ncbi:ribosomal-protein-alanine N-acetyltransferase [Solemya velum gill symbiont]|uniref:ribosomal protein S18-alanine N-acetyltransferase n=1 Tax=Solemya velum gill symbiont TaxID=2340 RepID=UPI000996B5B3|nr:ribosomal-protein-alanine N-acetyltransferase [Solemya velum gill symbiont]OOZ28234.1 ribosomal-protein-alanine N-acetyltransferase [Solemya velum gill symbiont]
MSAVIKPDEISCREMTRQDLGAVMKIETIAYKHAWTRGVFRDCLQAGYIGIIAEQESSIIGYAMLSAAAGEAHLLNICIHPHLQGRGYGRQLLDRLIAIARERSVETLFLEVRASNVVAQQLYLDYGFNEIGFRPNYYPDGDKREDALVYAMSLL